MVDACIRHESKAQRALYDMLAPMCMGVCLRYAGTVVVAEDLLQEGFVKVFEKIATLRDPEKIRPWAYQIMVNVSVQYLRKKEMVVVAEGVEDVPVSVDFSPFAMEDIVLAIGQLPPTQRMVFNLCEVEGYNHDEVAQMMRCSNVSVRVNLCRAKKHLKELLNNR